MSAVELCAVCDHSELVHEAFESSHDFRPATSDVSCALCGHHIATVTAPLPPVPVYCTTCRPRR